MAIVLQSLCFIHTINVTECTSKKRNKDVDIAIVRMARQLKIRFSMMDSVCRKYAIVLYYYLATRTVFSNEASGMADECRIWTWYINKLNMKDKKETKYTARTYKYRSSDLYKCARYNQCLYPQSPIGGYLEIESGRIALVEIRQCSDNRRISWV